MNRAALEFGRDSRRGASQPSKLFNGKRGASVGMLKRFNRRFLRNLGAVREMKVHPIQVNIVFRWKETEPIPKPRHINKVPKILNRL